ncbi:MAG: chorismate mutase [Micavibrio sp.]|nr:chorismate mutase [Micavibrio sp.]HCK31928.1 chorismate mutase [Rhodospirillaceae bacterium]|tara:strand:- start:163 stop:504 length:342 start_codon:yes stop_codon:yes gene_type:complete
MAIKEVAHNELKPLRDQIDALDDQILALFKKRFEIVDEVMKIKAAKQIPASLQDRVDQVHDRNVETAKEIGLDAVFASGLYSYVIDYTCAHEADIMPHDDNAAERTPTHRLKA